MDAGAGAARVTDAAGSGGPAADAEPAVHLVADLVEVDAPVESTSGRGATDFDDLFRSTYPTLVRALTVAADGGAAADAVQEAFVQANLHWRRVSRLDNPGAWVRRVAINRLSNHRRGLRRREAAVARLDPPGAITPSDPTDLDLTAALRALPDKQRLAVCLHYLAGLSVAEVAESLGVAPGTVKSNLHDARLALRARLEDPTDG